MAGSDNKIVLIGHSGRDPEVRYTLTGEKVASFSVATSERRRDQPDVTTWFRVSAFGHLADIAEQYLRKGSYVYIEGPLTLREYQGNDGTQRTSLEVRARELRMLDKAGDNQGQGQEEGQRQAQPAANRRREAQPVGVEDLPS